MAQQGHGLTEAELAFARRMLPHFLAGKSPAECAEAVLVDDNRLVNAALNGSHGFLGFNDQPLWHDDTLGRSLTSQISARVYDAFVSEQGQ